MHFVYILKSLKTNKYYTGSTNDIQKRLTRHNAGQNKSTKHGIPWILIYQEEFDTKQNAYKREMEIKRYKNGEAFKKIIK